MYKIIQRQHWNVGYLRYWQWRQIPNFMLAAPIVIISLYTVHKYTSFLLNKYGINFKEGLFMSISKIISLLWRFIRLFQDPLTPHVVHLLTVTMLGVFIAHVQITTRLICSSCPLIYIGLASIIKTKNNANIQKNDQRNQFLMIIYLVLFNFLGILLHPNFYPWT